MSKTIFASDIEPGFRLGVFEKDLFTVTSCSRSGCAVYVSGVGNEGKEHLSYMVTDEVEHFDGEGRSVKVSELEERCECGHPKGEHLTGVGCRHCSCHQDSWADAGRDQAKKSDAGKRPWELMPWGPLGIVVDVLAYGAGKYGARSWQSLDSPRERYSGALMRHAVAVMDGEWIDVGTDEEPGSGLPHWAHVACNALFLLHFGDHDE